MKRWLALLLIALMFVPAMAEEAVPEVTLPPVYAPADLTPEDIRAFVEAMFAAATGTTAEQEKEIRKDMTDEELQLRNAAGAEYRARTLPWLSAVFKPEIPMEELMPIPEASPTPEPTPEPTPDPETGELPEELPACTTRDSFAAFAETEPGVEYLALLESMGGDSREKCLLIAQEICGMWMAQVDHEKLSGMNEDYRCWIYAPGTQIDYPVVQCEDNSQYLKRLFNGARNAAGTLFIDYRNLPGFQDPNTLIYGHHMRNDSMFGALTDYAEQSYFEEHPIMLVMTPDEVFLLEIFAGYTTSDKDHCYDIAISDAEDMAAFVAEAERKSDFTSGVQVKPSARLVTLSTCAYAFENARYIAIAQILPVWNAQMAEMDSIHDADAEMR